MGNRVSGRSAERPRLEMEGGGEGSSREGATVDDFTPIVDFTSIVLTWSLDDIYNENLYQALPRVFCQSLAGGNKNCNLPYAEITESNPEGEGLYHVKVDDWKNNGFSDHGKESYKTLHGDLLILVDAKPGNVSELQRTECTWTFASVTEVADHDAEGGKKDLTTSSLSFKVTVPKGTEVTKRKHKQMFAIFLDNLSTKKRIWNALHMSKNWNILKKVLSPDSQGQQDCNQCLRAGVSVEDLDQNLFEDLDESQVCAIKECLLKIQCQHDSVVELIRAPPGTGKTITTGRMLFSLLKMKHRCLICAPTSVALKEVASHVFHLLKRHSSEMYGEEVPFCALGDILLFGSKDRLRADVRDMERIYLDYRVKRLAECIAPLTGWQPHVTSMIDFLNDAVSFFVEIGSTNLAGSNMSVGMSFPEFVRERFKSIVVPLLSCLSDIHCHISRSYLCESCSGEIIRVLGLLKTFGTILHEENLSPLGLEEAFSCKTLECTSKTWLSPIQLVHLKRLECLAALESVRDSLSKLNLPNYLSEHLMKEFCLQSASLIFCTASDAYELHSMEMKPIDVLVIDEAAHIKDCESVIAFQLPQLSHVILVGDEHQLPVVVQSKVSEEAGFGRSLFARLSSSGHFNHTLSRQYRMHPSISLFPNRNFYAGQIYDAPKVRSKSYLKCYLPSPMFGPYTFLNISDGREEREDGGMSWRNFVEVAVVLQILKNLYKAWKESKEVLSVGVISPYAAQVGAICERIPKKYETEDRFTVKVQTVDGFQGGEMDVIIISSVRSNSHGSVGFLSNPNCTNVALTRARYCLWILGNNKTLIESKSEWTSVVNDTMDRRCFFNAHDDTCIGKAIFEVKKEYDQLEDLLNGSSSLFRKARWKLIFSDNFCKAFVRLTSSWTKLGVMSMLLRLSCGWRPKRRSVELICESSKQIVKQFKVEHLYVLCTVDIKKEGNYIQVLKIWDILPLFKISQMISRVDSFYKSFTDDYICRCKEKCLEGNLEVPKAWDAPPFDFIRRRNLNEHSDGGSYAENTTVSESLLLMKFYSLSTTGIVDHFLSDHEGKEMELPFEVNEEQEEIISFPKSCFILGRSGTGKTTILTMKLFEKEQQFHIATNGCDRAIDTCRRANVDNICEDSNGLVLQQLFVTVSSKLCFAVKRQVSHMKSLACGGKMTAENPSDDIDFSSCADQFRDIPDSFVGVSENLYPMVVTFQKFLMMLDGSIGISFFERFPELREICKGKSQSVRSLALQTFVRAKEVSYEKFCAAYWPHFNKKLTSKLDPSRVFTEIISHVKGGIQVGDDGTLSRVDYVALSEGRASTLTSDEREKVYHIFSNYERMKAVNGDFDLSDLVKDLHSRLQCEEFLGDMIDFVYIDEVQDLTMRQIALFKYICKNVDEGYIFAGDTAQTIARGIDFRFEDIRCLFYKEFLRVSRSGIDHFREKGRLSEIVYLSWNFRTHSGVLKLAQSIIDLLSHFFPSLVDALSPETSPLRGQAPVFLESGTDENAIVSIFGNSTRTGGSIVGFGAEQVILVRDECAREEVLNFVGKKALVLTIVECKGLEFQDVFLYDFFGTTLLDTQWRVIYEYMNERDLLDDNFREVYPHFDQVKHNILCSELKQLYVAITRTRQRLWICENGEGSSKPMFDYWKKLGAIQVRKLDGDLAEEMKVASTPEEWKRQGNKLFQEANYDMAAMCFERAGYAHGEKLAKAFFLNEAADKMHVSNHDQAHLFRRQAAEIFESIGMGESAAKCFYALKEYERAGTIFESIGKAEVAAECFFVMKQYHRAGRIYLEKCDASALKRAGECFTLAGSYKQAAEVYARGRFFSDCLSVCARGKLFELGLQYIECWKGHTYKPEEVKMIEQNYLERCARRCHKKGDHVSMMKFVRAFSSVDAIWNFLKGLECLDELLSMEEELGNLLEAANVAKMKGDPLLESYMLGKGGRYKEASLCILWHVLFNSLWGVGSKGWSLKQFKEMEKLLAKAKSYAMLVPEPLSHYVETELTMEVSQTLNAACNSFVSSLHTPEFEFCHSKLVTQVFEVANFLLESKFLNIPHKEKTLLRNVIVASSMKYIDYMFPLDWRKSLGADMICLRRTEVSSRLLKETITNLIAPEAKLSYGLVGRLLVIILGSGKLLDNESFSKVSNCLEEYPPWKEVIECLYYSNDIAGVSQVLVISSFHEALQVTFEIDWRIEHDYISPVCFIYLLERLLVLTCFSCCECIFATKSGFVEWLHGEDIERAENGELSVFEFVPYVVRQLLDNKEDTIDWIVKSGINELDQYHRLLVLKLYLLLCTLFLNFGESWDLLVELLDTQWVCDKLPRPFVQILRKGFRDGRKDISVSVFAKAFREVHDPLMIICTAKEHVVRDTTWGLDAIFVDMSGNTSKEKVLESLFPDITNVSSVRHHQPIVHDHVGDDSSGSSSNVMETSESCGIPSLPGGLAPSDEVKTVMKLWRVLDALDKEDLEVKERAQIKEDLDQCLFALNIALNEYIWEAKGRFFDGDGVPDILRRKVAGTIDDFKRLSSALDIREAKIAEKLLSAVKEIVERLQSSRPVVEPLLYQMFFEASTNQMVGAEKKPKNKKKGGL